MKKWMLSLAISSLVVAGSDCGLSRSLRQHTVLLAVRRLL
jgi:hypothetical protein